MAGQNKKGAKSSRPAEWKGLTAYGEARSNSVRRKTTRSRLLRSLAAILGATFGLARAAGAWTLRRALLTSEGRLRQTTIACAAAALGAVVVAGALVASNSTASGVKPIMATAAVVSYHADPADGRSRLDQSDKAGAPNDAAAAARRQAERTIAAIEGGPERSPRVPLPVRKPAPPVAEEQVDPAPALAEAPPADGGINIRPSRLTRITVAAPAERILDRAGRLDPELRRVEQTIAETAVGVTEVGKTEVGKTAVDEAAVGETEERSGEIRAAVPLPKRKPQSASGGPSLADRAPSAPSPAVVAARAKAAIRPKTTIRIAIANPTGQARHHPNAPENAPSAPAEASNERRAEEGEPQERVTAETETPTEAVSEPSRDEPDAIASLKDTADQAARAAEGLAAVDPDRPANLPTPQQLEEIAKALSEIEKKIAETLERTKAAAAATKKKDAPAQADKTTGGDDEEGEETVRAAAEALAHAQFYEEAFVEFPELSGSGPQGGADPVEAQTAPKASAPPAAADAKVVPLPIAKPRRFAQTPPPPSGAPFGQRPQMASLPPATLSPAQPAPPSLPPGPQPPWLLNAVPFAAPPGKPLIAIVIDDLGLDRKRSERVVDLPGPLTMSYLTYARDLQAQTQRARRHGHELMLHMPMEPERRSADPGPRALKLSQNEKTIRDNATWGLDRFSGFVGVNNHMGSKFTSSAEHMRPFLDEVGKRGVVFLDSMTSHKSVGFRTARALGVPALARDVFLDHDPNLAAIENQLTLLELKALRRGYAIAIGHPLDTTIAALRKWLPRAAEKGFAIAPISAVMLRSLQQQAPIIARRGA